MNRLMSGITLVELMIAISLGLFLAFVAVQLLLQSQRDYKFVAGANNQLDSVRVVFSTLSEHVYKSGFRVFSDNWVKQAEADKKIFSKDTFFQEKAIVYGVNESGISGSDELWLRYQGSKDVLFRDCFNRHLSADNSLLYVFRFFLGSEGRFMCQRLGYPANEVVSGVADLQFQFGVGGLPGSNAIDDFVNADQVGLGLLYSWNQVRAIRVSVLLEADMDASHSAQKTYRVLDNTIKFDDGIRRFKIQKDLYLKNAIY